MLDTSTNTKPVCLAAVLQPPPQEQKGVVRRDCHLTGFLQIHGVDVRVPLVAIAAAGISGVTS